MINLTELRKVFAEKLIKTDNFDEAFTKALWVAYQQGIDYNKKQPLNELWSDEDEKRIDIIGQNSNEGLHYENN